MSFSVLSSVYIKENPEFLANALDSVFNQTYPPTEYILVKDGILTKELDTVVSEYHSKFPTVLKVFHLSENVGLGKALNYGLQFCSFDFVARMDTDDICYPERFEKQIKFLTENQDISVVGGVIQEFNSIPEDLNQFRKLPTDSNDLEKFAKYRNPLSHPSVMFRKFDVLSVGSYEDMPYFEDYYLWIKLLRKGYKIANINDSILHFRIGNDMIGRRSGIQYTKKEIHFLKSIRGLQFINSKEYYFSILTKIPLRLFPKKILLFIYQKLLR